MRVSVFLSLPLMVIRLCVLFGDGKAQGQVRRREQARQRDIGLIGIGHRREKNPRTK
jgi:hypothetical protein